jgi:multidrug efflux pump subunit AcrA (membrane-fusion protein)
MKCFSKFALRGVGLLAMLSLLVLIAGCGKQQAGQQQTLYTCGMHPQVIQNKPGNCPICGMKLTPIRKQPGSTPSTNAPGSASGRKIKYYKSTMSATEVSPTPAKDSMGMEMVPVYEDQGNSASSAISIDPVTIQNMDLRTDVVGRGRLQRAIRTVGVVDFDESSLSEVTTKFKGWIEKLYVDTTGQQVHKGQPLFEIYSPELYSAQTEFIVAAGETSRTGLGADIIKNSPLDKLRYFDVSEEQIADLQKSKKVKKTLQVTAPNDGIVVEKMVVQGQMVDAGMKLYRLADLGTVWVQSQVYEQDLPFVRLGQEAVVSLSYLSDRKFRGRVTFIYPTVDEKTRTARVRMEFHNPGFFLKPGMFATVELAAEIAEAVLLVPDMAVLRSGEKNTVFVALEGGKFEPRVVTLGPRGQDNRYQVVTGLKEGERIVTSGQFMLDSESQLREAIQKMIQPKNGEPLGLAPGATNVTATTSTETSPTSAIVYICPMPEHVALEYEHPGKCPLCGMTLVPVSKDMLARIQPGGKVEYWTCPMPEHSDVREQRQGKCPRCGMTLIPVMLQAKPADGTANSTNAIPSAPTLYTCPMASHANVVSDKPGVCPKCKMKLVPTSEVNHGKIAEQHWMEQHAIQPH